MLQVARMRLLNPDALLTMDKSGVSMVRGLVESGAGRDLPLVLLGMCQGDMCDFSLDNPG